MIAAYGQRFMKQVIMRRVLVALVPILLLSVYLFGLRVLPLLAVVTAIGVVTEYLVLRSIQGPAAKVSEAVFVTCLLFTLTLPPSTPYWVAGVGIAFGVLFGKGVFGGFGRNIFNPALVGRCLIYIAFPRFMTTSWTIPFSGFPGGFLRYAGGADTMTSATPMILLRDSGEATPLLNLFLGTISGSLGETSALLILIAAAYLLATKTASWRIMLACAATFAALSAVFHYAAGRGPDPLTAVLSGGFLFATVFMATDPVSAPSRDLSKILYGVLIGASAVVIRLFALFTEGIMFAILVANAFAPLLDRQVKALADRRKPAAKAEAGP